LYLLQEVWQDLFLGITRALLILIGLLLLELRPLLITIVLVGGTTTQLVLQQVLPGTHQLLCTQQTVVVLEETEAQPFRLLLLPHIYITAEQVRNVLVLEIAVTTEEVLTIKRVMVLVIILLAYITTLEHTPLANLRRSRVVRQTLAVVVKD
jgi:hypothetical protein